MIGEVLFRIGPLAISTFGVMAALGFLVPFLLIEKELPRKGLNPRLAYGMLIAATVGGLVGARIYYIAERWDRFLADPVTMIFTGSGLVWYGGLLGGFLLAIGYVHLNRVSIPLICDLMAPLLALGQAFGRMGCLLSGDGDYGPPTDVAWGMSFPNGIVPTLDRVHPTPIYDIVFLLAIFALLWRIRTKQFPPWFVFSLYLLLLGIGRFITEFYRNTPEVFLGLTAAQFISVGLIVAGGTYVLVAGLMPSYGRRVP